MKDIGKTLLNVALIESTDIGKFIPVMREIELGDRFLLSMLHWCGIGKRSTPLDLWRVFLIGAHDEIVGITGIYRQPGMPKTACWIGWFGIRPNFRRRGYGRSAVLKLVEVARDEGCDELFVYTGSEDCDAIQFYKGIGFKVLGVAASQAPGQTMNSSDIILRQVLSKA